MKCFFCNTEITDEYISAQRICNEAIVCKLDKNTKEYKPVIMDMNFCSRECAIAENILFNVGLELSENISVNEVVNKYDDEAVKILSESFDKVMDKVIKECDCTEEEFNDAETRFFKVMGKSTDLIDPRLKKYL
jgi:hypothetical protein